MKVITKQDEPIVKFFSDMERGIKLLEELSTQSKPPFDNERYLTDKQLSDKIKSAVVPFRNTGTKE